ncbi:MAG: ribosome biogenesis GTPase Der [Puniceicoccaceae bacterium]
MEERQIVLVGRPNVGKSRLFNRLAGKRVSIVHDLPGVTRDIVTHSLKGGRILVDTGGLGLVEGATPEVLREAVETQVFVATGAASVILFVVDVREGLTPLDEEIATDLRRSKCPVKVVVNKCDTEEQDTLALGASRLGFGEPFAVSAEHNRGIRQLEKWIFDHVPSAEEGGDPQAAEERRVGICFAGKPNVGKSSLTNRLLNAERLIVSDVPGTTRDSVAFNLDWKGSREEVRRYRLHDTAGLRAKRKIDDSIEYFSSLRTREAVEKSDVVVYLLDALTGVTKQDQKFVGEVLKAGRGLVLAVNKWDLALESFATGGVEGYESKEDFAKAYEVALRKELFFLPESPVVFLSAQMGHGIEPLLAAVGRVDRVQHTRLATGPLNRLIQDLFEETPPKAKDGKRFKLYYTVQTGVAPIRLKVFCNDPERLDDSYRRYLEKGIISHFNLIGSPLEMKFVGKVKEQNPFLKR